MEKLNSGGRTIEYGPVVVYVDDCWGRVTLNRDEKRNAINFEVADALVEASEQLSAAGVRVAVLAARGAAFCAGNDVGGSDCRDSSMSPVEIAWCGVSKRSIFWIAEVNGACAGGGVALALSCPLVVMSDDAWLWLPELSRLRTFPSPVVHRLSKTIGMRDALGLAATQRRIWADEALSRGWVSAVVSREQLGMKVDGLVAELARADSLSVSAAAEMWRESLEGVREKRW